MTEGEYVISLMGPTGTGRPLSPCACAMVRGERRVAERIIEVISFFILGVLVFIGFISAGNAADTMADTGETLVANIGLTLRANTGRHRTDTLVDIARQ